MATRKDPFRFGAVARPRRSRGRALLAAALVTASISVGATSLGGGTAHAIDLWSDPVDLSQAGSNATVPQVASDADGDAVAVWLRIDGPNYYVEASHFASGTGGSPGAWGATTVLSSSTQIIAEPNVEIDDAGNAVAIWRQSDGTNFRVYARRYAASTGTWQGADILSAAGGDARAPQLSVDAAGNFTAVWYRFNPNPVFRYLIETSRLPVGGSWTAAEAISSADDGDAAISRIASDAAGNVIAIWRVTSGTTNTVQAKKYDAHTQVWSPVVDIAAADSDAANIQVAVDPAGNATAVWAFGTPGAYVISASRYSASSSTFAWSTPIQLSASGGNAVGPRVGADASGAVTAVWRRENVAGNSIVQSSRFDPTSGAWGAPIDLSAAGRNGISPRLAVDPSGNVTAVWVRKNDGTYFTVQSARYSHDSGGWGAATDLSAPGQNGESPQTDVDDDGNVVVVWDRSNGANTIVQAAVSSPAPGFTPVSPTRVFDTRPGYDGAVSVPKAKVGGANVLQVPFAGIMSGSTVITPATGITAVSMNVAVTNTDGDGFVTVYPCDTRKEVASVNFVRGQTVSNAVIAPVSPSGALCFYSYAPADIIVDINGWFPATSSFHPVSPSRVFDTRPGESADAIRTVAKQKVGPGSPLQVQVVSLGTLTPASGVSAVSLNVAVTNPNSDGFVTVFACGDRPFTASVNYVGGQTVSNAVIAPVSADGNICFYSLKPTDVIVDINGWFSTETGFTAAGPARVVDTRGDAESPNAIVKVPVAKVTPTSELRLKVTDLLVGSVTITPPIGVAAVSLNVTAVNPDGDGFITAYPCDNRPNAANVNYLAHQVVPNAVIAPVSADGYVCFYSYAPVDLVVDINGWFPLNS